MNKNGDVGVYFSVEKFNWIYLGVWDVEVLECITNEGKPSSDKR